MNTRILNACAQTAVALFVLAIGGAVEACAAEQALESALVEGTWTCQNPKTILGSGTDVTIAIKQDGARWTLAYDITSFPSINDRGAKPTHQRQGPYPVAVEDQELVITKEAGKAPSRYTFLCDQRRLILPAFVQTKPGEWNYRCDDESFVVRCEHDPAKEPVGKALIEGLPGGKGYYSFEEAPRSEAAPHGQYLRLLERSDKNGELWERCRLVFDDYGWPRYVRLLSTGQRETNSYQLGIYLAPEKAPALKTQK